MLLKGSPTENNAKRPLYQLFAMAHMRPDGIWDGDQEKT